MGSAGAFVARAEDNSALFYNPAGLAKLKKGELTFSIQAALQRGSYSNIGQSTWRTESAQDVFPSLIINKTFGRFGLAAGRVMTGVWESEWLSPTYPGRFSSTGSSFEAQTLAFGGSFALTRYWALGMTLRSTDVDYRYARRLNRFIDDGAGGVSFFEVDESRNLSGDDTGFQLGLSYYRGRNRSFGLTYESGMEIDLAGDRAFALAPEFAGDQRFQAEYANLFSAGSVATTMWLPQRVNVGFATRVTIRTRLEANIAWEDWSEWEQSVFTFEGSAQPHVIDRQFRDVFAFRVGGDFQQRRALLWRIGIGTRRSIVPSNTFEPSFAESDQFMYTGGMSYTMGSFVLEAAYMYMQYRDREIRGLEYRASTEPPDYAVPTGASGFFENQRHHFNLGLRWRFD